MRTMPLAFLAVLSVWLPTAARASNRSAPAAAWNAHFAALAPAPWAKTLGLDFSQEAVRWSFASVAAKVGLAPMSLLDAPDAQAQTAAVRAAVGAYAADLLQRFQRVENLGEVFQINKELAALNWIAGAVPEALRPQLLQTRQAVDLYLRAENADRLRDKIEGVAKAWSKATQAGALAAPAVQSGRKSRETLSGIFGGERIERVFNGDAGTGRWQRDILDKPWLSPEAEIVGYDLPTPIKYTQSPEVNPGDWSGIKVATDRGDALFPQPGTIDLAHGAFLEMAAAGFAERLELYQSLVREGGFFIVAHNHAYSDTIERNARSRLMAQFMETGDWNLVAYFDGDEKPSDYPVTEWWEQFKSVRSPYWTNDNFILIFQKKRVASPSLVPALTLGLN